MEEYLIKLQKKINVKFKKVEYLKKDITHKSFDPISNYEKLEFLGDRVLGLVVSSLIFNKFKNYNEGDLTKKFSYLVQREFLYKIALEINLPVYLKFNKRKISYKTLLHSWL